MACKSYGQLTTALAEASRRPILHIHWTSPICQQPEHTTSAYTQLYGFRHAVRRFKARGGKVVWTVHNAQPHELPRPDLEAELVNFVADEADRIHVMNPATVELIRPTVKLREGRVRQIPHPSYAGVYPTGRSRSEMREQLGLNAADRVVALIGLLRPYKGVATLLDAAHRVPERERERLVVLLAGRTLPEELDDLRESLPSDVRVILHPEFIESSELADWFRASDLCVLPYERILNSGSAHLAATVGVPVVLPGEQHLRDQFGDQTWVRFYDREHAVEDLASLLADPATYEMDGAAAHDFCRGISPWRVSLRMLDELYAPLVSPRSSQHQRNGTNRGAGS